MWRRRRRVFLLPLPTLHCRLSRLFRIECRRVKTIKRMLLIQQSIYERFNEKSTLVLVRWIG